MYLRVLLGLVLAGCAWVFWQDLRTATPAIMSRPATPTRPAVATAQPAADNAPALASDAVVDLFPAQSWLPPRPPSEPTRPAAPQAPPIPFSVSAQWRYLGQSKIVVLQRPDGVRYTLCQSCSVAGHIRPGATFDKDYRLDRLTDTQVVLTYLPLRQVTTLRLDTP